DVSRRGQREGVGVAADRGTRVRRQVDGAGHRFGGQVEDRDLVAVGVRGVQLTAVGVDEQGAGVLADGDGTADGRARGVHEGGRRGVGALSPRLRRAGARARGRSGPGGGLPPAATVRTERVARSITETELDKLFAVHTVLPSADTATPAGKWFTATPAGLVVG